MQLISALSGPSFAFLQPAEGTPIALQEVTALPPGVPAQQGGFEINLEVDDLDTALQEWKSKGAEVVAEIADMGAGRWFGVKDPDGYMVAVYQLYPQVKAMRQ